MSNATVAAKPDDAARPRAARGTPEPVRVPGPPPLRVVDKGWFTYRESTQTVEEARRENEARRAKAAAR